MSYYIETGYDSLTKYGEELCGDKVEVVRNNDSVIIVLADGLGSGVKANILATLTSKIIGTMLNEGADIDDCVETIANTLPVCRERGIAYSTFTILKICNSGEAYLAEFDNPEVMFIRKGKPVSLEKTVRTVKDKKISESRFTVAPEDMLILFSDGVVHAGVGRLLNLGWQYENVQEYIQNAMRSSLTSLALSRQLVSACDSLYLQRPGDDTTVAAARVLKPVEVRVLVGPPVDPKDDTEAVHKLLEGDGRKMICGGTTSQIFSRVTERELKVNLEYHSAAVPPTGSIDGIDLVTEGVLTLGKALEIIRQYVSFNAKNGVTPNLSKKDGATRAARLLLEESTKVHFIVGRAMNPAHQNPDLPLSLSIKLRLVEDIAQCLRSLGKEVEVEYY